MSVDSLYVEKIAKSFGGLKALRETSLRLGVGERVSVIGTNGAGKSTLFNCVAGAFPATSGRIHLFGEDVTRLAAARRARKGLARTFQTSELFEQLTALENVLLALSGNEFRGEWLRPYRGNRQRWDRGLRLLERVGLADRSEALVADLSHGEQRQLELAMALALQPRILMLDEPAAGFSPAERKNLIKILRELPEELSLLLIEHDMDIALSVASRIIVMHDGEKILEGTPSEIRASTRVREIYLGGEINAA